LLWEGEDVGMMEFELSPVRITNQTYTGHEAEPQAHFKEHE
jgi:hypothetical protein